MCASKVYNCLNMYVYFFGDINSNSGIGSIMGCSGIGAVMGCMCTCSCDVIRSKCVFVMYPIVATIELWK